MFIILKPPILNVCFLQNLSTMNTLDPIFYRTLFLRYLLVTSQGTRVAWDSWQIATMLGTRGWTFKTMYKLT